ncbi:TIGR03086 family metal-binding protein [Streptomyces olivoverticillatus]
MTTKLSDLLTAAAREAGTVVHGISDDQLDAPTPCAEYAVRDLLNHLFHVVINFQALAAKEAADFSSTPDYLSGDWRTRFEQETRTLAEAWAAPGAEDGTTGLMNMPARTVGSMALLDLTVHAWDLARATSQPFTPAPTAIPALLPLVAELAPTGRQMSIFGAPFPAGANPTPFEEILAITGRNPRWTR